MVLHITPSERDALRLMADGKANREIARDLGISEGAAEAHLAALFERMGAQSRSEAIGVAVRRGLLYPAQRRANNSYQTATLPQYDHEHADGAGA